MTSFKEHISAVTSIKAQGVMDSNLVVSGSQDTNVKLWDLRSKRSVFTLKMHSKPINCVAIAEDSKFIASGASDSNI